MQNNIVNEEDFNHEIIGTNLKHISESLPSVNDFKVKLPPGLIVNSKYLNCSNFGTLPTEHSNNFLVEIKKLATRKDGELTKAKAEYYLQSIIYKNMIGLESNT